MTETKEIQAREPEVQENKMGTMPVNRLLITMAGPMILSMLVQALYNVVDSIFVSHYSQGGLTALSLAFPVQSLMIAVATGTGVGINAMLSKSLGEKNKENVDIAAGNGVFLALCSYVVFMFFGIFGVRPFFDPEGHRERYRVRRPVSEHLRHLQPGGVCADNL